MERIETEYGPVVSVYDSSATDTPHVWLAIDSSPLNDTTGTTYAHLSLAQAKTLRRALKSAIKAHQG